MGNKESESLFQKTKAVLKVREADRALELRLIPWGIKLAWFVMKGWPEGGRPLLEQTIFHYKMRLRFYPEVAYWIHFNIGSCYVLLGKNSEALTHREEALLFYPQHLKKKEQFQSFVEGYLEILDRIRLEEVSTKPVKETTPILRGMVRSLTKVLQKHPDVGQIERAKSEVLLWLQQASTPGKIPRG